MKSITSILLFFITFCSLIVAQNDDIRNESVSQGVKIYTIRFFSSLNGLADSFFGDVLITTNGGNNWELKSEAEEEINKDYSSDIVWSADIYCEVKLTTDGGENWRPYPKKKEEHFCNVYFKDKNTGWKVGEEFLQKVVSTITAFIRSENWEKEIGVPQKCREYYTDMETGWWVGWCYNNLVTQ